MGSAMWANPNPPAWPNRMTTASARTTRDALVRLVWLASRTEIVNYSWLALQECDNLAKTRTWKAFIASPAIRTIWTPPETASPARRSPRATANAEQQPAVLQRQRDKGSPAQKRAVGERILPARAPR